MSFTERARDAGCFVLIGACAFGCVTASSQAAKVPKGGTTLGPPPPTAAESDAAAMPLSVQPFPKVDRDAEGRDLIRVRIFPHARDKEVSPAIVGACTSGPGKKGVAAPDGPLSKPGKPVTRVELSPKKMAGPLWVRCPDGARLEIGEPNSGMHFLGDFYARVRKGQGAKPLPYVEVINVVPIESYLRGVVPIEIGPAWPMESLRAQAVAARTFAYFHIAFHQSSRDKDLYHVDDTPTFQAYSGLADVTPSTDKAIADTAGVVIQVADKLIQAFFHADSGGHTETAAEVFGLNAPYCAARPEPKEVGPPTTWVESVPLSEIERRLGPKYIPKGRHLAAARVEPMDRTASGRARTVTLVLDDGVPVVVGSIDFKRAAGGLTSSLYDVKSGGPGVLRIEGKGSGHGVGLSQRSARDLAAQGWRYPAILDFYYAGSALCALAPKDGEKIAVCRAPSAAAQDITN